jgi:hypothetical protein
MAVIEGKRADTRKTVEMLEAVTWFPDVGNADLLTPLIYY